MLANAWGILRATSIVLMCTILVSACSCQYWGIAKHELRSKWSSILTKFFKDYSTILVCPWNFWTNISVRKASNKILGRLQVRTVRVRPICIRPDDVLCYTTEVKGFDVQKSWIIFLERSLVYVLHMNIWRKNRWAGRLLFSCSGLSLLHTLEGHKLLRCNTLAQLRT